MQIRFVATRPSGDHALIVPIAGTARGGLDSFGAAKNGIEAAMKRQRFEGEAGSAADHYLDEDGGRRLVLIGIGSEPKPDRAERLGGAVTARLLTSGEREAVIDLSSANFGADDAARVALGVTLRGWRHDRYRTRLKDKLRPTLDLVTIVGAADGAEARWTDRYAPLAEGVMLTRELVAEPANIIYPESFVERVRHLTDLGVEIRVLDEAEMTKLGMGALLGVSQGSARDAQLLVMTWNGAAAGTTPTVFVGKGVTFDTGGISIKPAQGMEGMKWDMGGAGAVAGAMKALAGRKAKANVVGICGLVENMPDGNAQRPGDVVTTMSGQTVEVINTDAEGRLVLSDAITWAQQEFAPKTIIDLATLTGAMVVSLGHEYAGIFANDEPLEADLIKAGEASGDKLWRQPLGEAYDRLIDSPIADMKNVGPREAGAITAAQFIKRFVDDGVAWAHLDIAGMAWSDKACPTYDKGATGYGVRLLDQYIADTVENGC
ncbi:MAG: leucyl aminopeptidase [Pseudomonadota bacterium]|nr:leucyl aminopeptidase [Pseudomonadota bacterium]